MKLHRKFVKLQYCKTPLISTYVFSGLVTVQVLFFGGHTFGGYDKAGWKIHQGRSLFNVVISVENTLLCMFQRLSTYFQDTGVLIFGGTYLRGIAADSKFQEKMKGYLFSEGYLFTGFYGTSFSQNTNNQFSKARRFGRVAPAIFKYETSCFAKLPAGVLGKRSGNVHTARAHSEPFCIVYLRPPLGWGGGGVGWGLKNALNKIECQDDPFNILQSFLLSYHVLHRKVEKSSRT